MKSQERYKRATDLFEAGRYAEALQEFQELLAQEESSTLWNDWATVQLASGNSKEAEKGYRRALEIDAQNGQAAANLGILLAGTGRGEEAIPFLEQAAVAVDEKQRTHLLEILQECGRQQSADVPEAKKAGIKSTTDPLRVLVVHEILPEYDRTGCDQRLMQVLRELRLQGSEVTYIARHGANRERYLPVLEEMGITVYAHDGERLRALGYDDEPTWTLEEVFAAAEYDLAILYHWYWTGIPVSEHYLQDIKQLSPYTRVAVLTDDRHGLREQRLAELSGGAADWERSQDFWQRELEVYRRADLVLTVSEDDRQGLLSVAPELQIKVLPNDAESLIEAGASSRQPGFWEREGLLFLGNYDNQANRDSVQWFLDEVWPRLRARLPGVALYLVGNNLPANFAADCEGVVRVGYVADLGEAFARARVSVSPVRYGTGTKTKNLNAMVHGLPVVTSTIGAEGLDLKHRESALIADSPEEFAEAVVQLYTDEPLWKAVAQGGREHIVRRFSRRRLQEQIARLASWARTFQPGRDRRQNTFSSLQVEREFPEVVTCRPIWHRAQLRVQAYAQMGQRLLAQGRPSEGREQFRHIFGFVQGRPDHNEFFTGVWASLERCYRELGEHPAAERCHREAQTSLPLPGPERAPSRSADSAHPFKRRKRRHQPEISVVVPTYNRRATLEKCLMALADQTLDPSRYEVVVVDDESSDSTAEFCQTLRTAYSLRYLRQKNSGAGAARRLGVKEARGEYVLLFNDDTIAGPGLLAEHLRVLNRCASGRCAVLGDFRYPPAASRRALTYFLATNPFLFPQLSMEAGAQSKNAYFISSNLSIRRSAVLEVGSFDAHFRVAEDTELGVRLRRAGYEIVYDPLAWAWHDHPQFTTQDLIRRAQAYAQAEYRLLRKHPHLLGSGEGQFGLLEESDAVNLAGKVDSLRDDIPEAVRALEKYDDVDFYPFFDRTMGESTAAEEVMRLFGRAVPTIFWFHLWEKFLQVWAQDLGQTVDEWVEAARKERETEMTCRVLPFA